MAISCDPSSLAQQAKCFKCLSPATLLEVQVYLLCQIVNGSGSGASGNFPTQGTVDPVAAPGIPSQPAYYTNLTTGTIWTWNVTTQTWV